METPVYEDVIVEKKVEKVIQKYVDVPQYEYRDVEVIKQVEVPVKKDVIVKKEVQK